MNLTPEKGDARSASGSLTVADPAVFKHSHQGIMGSSLHRSGVRVVSFGVVALASFSLTVSAQEVSTCKGPASLERAVASHPSAAAYDALGAYFGQHGQFSCAFSAFGSALHLEPNSWEAHYNLGLALLTSGDANRAEQEFRTTVRLQPEKAQSHAALGMALSQLNQADGAIDEFQKALAIDPKFVPALDGLANLFITQKRYSAAVACLKGAPPNEGLQLDLAIAYSKNGDATSAIKLLSLLVKEHPSSAQAHSNLAVAYIQQDRYREAAGEFQEALRLNPSDDVVRVSYVKALIVLAEFNTALPLIKDYQHRNPGTYDAVYLRGAIDRGLGKYADAEPVLRRAVELEPNSYDARYNLGFVLAKLGKTNEAYEQLEKAAQLNPASSEAHFQLAGVLRTMGQEDKARAELRIFEESRQASVKQDIAGTKANQANEFLQKGDPQQAAAVYREAIAQDPNNARTYYDLALALDQMGQLKEERDVLQKSLALDPNFAPVHNQLGFLSLRAGHAEDAEKQFKAAISLNPQYAEAQNNLGVVYGQQGKTKDAEELFREATENDPQYAQAFANLGLILAGEVRLPEADQALESALRLGPNNTKALTGRAMVLTRLNRQAEAIDLFRKVVTLDPKSPGAHLNLGIALADQYNLQGALAEFSEAVRLDPNSAAAHYNKGRVLLDLQRNMLAKPELEIAVRLDPQAADSWYLLGLIQKQAGNTAESIKLFDKAAAIEPNDPDILYMLGQGLLRQGDKAGAIAQWKRVILINPEYSEALYNLSRLLGQSDPEQAKVLQARFENLQREKHIMDRAQTLGNFALASAAARDWPKAISQLKEGLQLCGHCSALALLHKDLGLIYCRSGDLKNGQVELLEAQKLIPNDPDIEKALHILDSANR